jgi:transcriptional regulator with XRE-family HTH domain
MDRKVTIPDVQIGQKVQEIFEARKMKLSDFADQLGTVRQNVYRIFKKKDLDTGLLTKISEVLNHNFFQYYQSFDADAPAGNAREAEEYRSQLELSRKEIDYLKKIINLMEEKAKLLQEFELK